MGQTKKAKVTFTCTFEMKDYLNEWSISERRTISNLVEGLIEEIIATRKAQQQEQQPPVLVSTGDKGEGASP